MVLPVARSGPTPQQQRTRCADQRHNGRAAGAPGPDRNPGNQPPRQRRPRRRPWTGCYRAGHYERRYLLLAPARRELDQAVENAHQLRHIRIADLVVRFLETEEAAPPALAVLYLSLVQVRRRGVAQVKAIILKPAPQRPTESAHATPDAAAAFLVGEIIPSNRVVRQGAQVRLGMLRDRLQQRDDHAWVHKADFQGLRAGPPHSALRRMHLQPPGRRQLARVLLTLVDCADGAVRPAVVQRHGNAAARPGTRKAVPERQAQETHDGNRSDEDNASHLAHEPRLLLEQSVLQTLHHWSQRALPRGAGGRRPATQPFRIPQAAHLDQQKPAFAGRLPAAIIRQALRARGRRIAWALGGGSALSIGFPFLTRPAGPPDGRRRWSSHSVLNGAGRREYA